MKREYNEKGLPAKGVGRNVRVVECCTDPICHLLILGEKLASTMQGEKEDIDNAVTAAREAFKSWSKLPGHVRARYLYSIARHVQKHARLIAVLESLDNGKPIRETRDADVQIVARHLYHHAGWAQLMDTEMKGKQFILFLDSEYCP